MAGVAVIIKELLKLLDNESIPHADESDLRRQLRKRRECKTSGNQHFLKQGSSSKTIDRGNGDTRNMSCVIVPRKDIPECFFSLLEGG